MAAEDEDFVFSNSITHILNCSSTESEVRFSHLGVKYLSFPWVNNPECVLFESDGTTLASICSFIDQALEAQQCLLVYSMEGDSRAVVALAAYLVKKFHWLPSRAVQFIKAKRLNANPKAYFVRQLNQLAKAVEARAGTPLRDIFDPQRAPSLSREELLHRCTFLNATNNFPAKPQITRETPLPETLLKLLTSGLMVTNVPMTTTMRRLKDRHVHWRDKHTTGQVPTTLADFPQPREIKADGTTNGTSGALLGAGKGHAVFRGPSSGYSGARLCACQPRPLDADGFPRICVDFVVGSGDPGRLATPGEGALPNGRVPPPVSILSARVLRKPDEVGAADYPPFAVVHRIGEFRERAKRAARGPEPAPRKSSTPDVSPKPALSLTGRHASTMSRADLLSTLLGQRRHEEHQALPLGASQNYPRREAVSSRTLTGPGAREEPKPRRRDAPAPSIKPITNYGSLRGSLSSTSASGTALQPRRLSVNPRSSSEGRLKPDRRSLPSSRSRSSGQPRTATRFRPPTPPRRFDTAKNSRPEPSAASHRSARASGAPAQQEPYRSLSSSFQPRGPASTRQSHSRRPFEDLFGRGARPSSATVRDRHTAPSSRRPSSASTRQPAPSPSPNYFGSGSLAERRRPLSQPRRSSTHGSYSAADARAQMGAPSASAQRHAPQRLTFTGLSSSHRSASSDKKPPRRREFSRPESVSMQPRAQYGTQRSSWINSMVRQSDSRRSAANARQFTVPRSAYRPTATSQTYNSFLSSYMSYQPARPGFQ